MRSIIKGLGAGVVVSLLAASASAQDAPSWCKSKWGANDEKGAANLLTPELAAEAAKLVKAGKTYQLGVETNSKSPAYPPRAFNLTVLQPGQVGGASLGPTKTTYNDDIIAGWVGVGSQLDGLGHIGVDNVYFNCNKAADFAAADGLKKLGIEKVPPIVTRGVVLDMTAVIGKSPVPAGTPFNKKEIDEALQKQGIQIKKGDVVLFHTGWQDLATSDPKAFMAGEPGLGKEGAEYLASKEVVAVGADQWGLEVLPFEKGVGVFEVHQILLARNGVYILENMNTGPLVADKAWEFMFVLGPSRITGAVQAIINPVAIR
ncbi:MAG: cyclase family protein [Hyphomicrobiaceae bacterium]|nr:cyclase family protein [Hyphomicrobiaceae bacterium]